MNDQTPRVEDYEPLGGVETAGWILWKAKTLAGFYVAHINSTHFGGGFFRHCPADPPCGPHRQFRWLPNRKKTFVHD